MNKLIEIPLPKGCRLFLTPGEYARGIKRGKAIRRARQARQRAEKRAAELRNTNLEETFNCNFAIRKGG